VLRRCLLGWCRLGGQRRGRRDRGRTRPAEAGDPDAEQAAGRFGQLTERGQPAHEVVDRVDESAQVGRQRADDGRVERLGQLDQARHDLIDRTGELRRELVGKAHRAHHLRNDGSDRLLELAEQAVDPLDGVVEVRHRAVEVLEPLHQLVGTLAELVERADDRGDRTGDERDDVRERIGAPASVSHDA
jgi:hypothetical protein